MNFSKSDYKICIVGLGYVGLPLSAIFASKGFDIIGFDINNIRVKELSSNIDRNDDIDLDKLKILNQNSKLTHVNLMRLLHLKGSVFITSTNF